MTDNEQHLTDAEATAFVDAVAEAHYGDGRQVLVTFDSEQHATSFVASYLADASEWFGVRDGARVFGVTGVEQLGPPTGGRELPTETPIHATWYSSDGMLEVTGSQDDGDAVIWQLPSVPNLRAARTALQQEFGRLGTAMRLLQSDTPPLGGAPYDHMRTEP